MMMVQVENQILLLIMSITGVQVENQILLFIMFMSSVHRCWWWCLVQVENQILFFMFMSRAYRCDNVWCRWRNWLAGLIDVDVWGRWSNWLAVFIDDDMSGAGAGGGRIRPDLTKQRSLSGEPSPAHSRCASSTSEILVRSSSEGNIADPRELIEKLRGKGMLWWCSICVSADWEHVWGQFCLERHILCHFEPPGVWSPVFVKSFWKSKKVLGFWRVFSSGLLLFERSGEEWAKSILV